MCLISFDYFILYFLASHKSSLLSIYGHKTKYSFCFCIDTRIRTLYISRLLFFWAFTIWHIVSSQCFVFCIDCSWKLSCCLFDFGGYKIHSHQSALMLFCFCIVFFFATTFLKSYLVPLLIHLTAWRCLTYRKFCWNNGNGLVYAFYSSEIPA